ncbi:TadE/TadG family type IV pilus assembly protein [Sphingomonas sp. HMP9]|uniref:TadE/TadG family type IV pilus assembly protein n=1 Tax=Sphingomonas sp. HMP9 TaxID=1517554 RepID=UPI001E39AC79|nr:TadE/TadG family type IV pilus assembly protein [Sphingomonas sp. HMP9]
MSHQFRALRRDTRGATIVEFAIIIPVLVGLLLSILEIGYQGYVTAVVQGALSKASRQVTVGGRTAADVVATIKSEVQGVVPAQYVTVSTRRYYNFSNVGKPEKITSDTDPKGVFNLGDCYEDANNNGNYDLTPGDTGVGSADDIVYYTVNVVYPNLTPVGALLSWAPTRSVAATTVIRNQPFTSRAEPTTICTKAP